MLIKITSKCSMGCSHCMNNATKNGLDMTFSTLRQVVKRINEFNPSTLIISGGEPTEHEYFYDFMFYLSKKAMKNRKVTITTNGKYFESHVDVVKDLKRRINNLEIQVSNVPGLYPVDLNLTSELYNLPYVYISRMLEAMQPLGRASSNHLEYNSKCSSCFNFRLVRGQLSLINSDYTMHDVINTLEKSNKFCTCTIKSDGTFTAGESDLCMSYGDVYTNEKQLLNNLKNLECHQCDFLNKNVSHPLLSHEQLLEILKS